MKKRILYLFAGILLLAATCTPVEFREEAGPIVPASEFDYTITNMPGEDYKLIFRNNTPQVMFSWDYGWGVTRKQHDTVKILVPGTYEIKITATTAGGIVTDSKSVMVTMAAPGAFEEPEWEYLTSLVEGKTWVWDNTVPSPWGNGGFKGCYAPCWWSMSMTELAERGVGSDEMKFDLNGGRNLTLTAASVPAAYAGVTKGSFDLDFSVYKEGWDIGKLTTTNVTIINGIQANFDDQIEDAFYILKLTNDELVLSAPEPGVTGDWGDAWFWLFRPKE